VQPARPASARDEEEASGMDTHFPVKVAIVALFIMAVGIAILQVLLAR
jgi:hypothetical protein